jgi:hypothetical protein
MPKYGTIPVLKDNCCKQFALTPAGTLREMAIFHPFEYLTELQGHSAAVVARPGESRLDDYASSPAILADAVSFG